MSKSLSSSSHNFISKTAELVMFTYFRNRQCTKFYIANFWSRQSIERKRRLFSPLGFDIQGTSDHDTTKIRVYLVRALKRYLSEKHLIYGRVTATISKFSA